MNLPQFTKLVSQLNPMISTHIRSFQFLNPSLGCFSCLTVNNSKLLIVNQSRFYRNTSLQSINRFHGCTSKLKKNFLKNSASQLLPSNHHRQLQNQRDKSSNSLDAQSNANSCMKTCDVPESNAANSEKISGEQSSQKSSASSIESTLDTSDNDASLTLTERFKQAYKNNWKVLLAVHTIHCSFWFSSIYLLVCSGIDLAYWGSFLHFPQFVRTALEAPHLGTLAGTLIIYKMIMPVRYLGTLWLSKLAIQNLRRLGYMAPLKKEDQLRNLFKEGTTQSKEKFEKSVRKRITNMDKRRKNIKAKINGGRSASREK